MTLSSSSVIKLAYIFGALAAAAALYLILHPYSVHVDYSGPLKPMNLSTSGGWIFVELNNTGRSEAEVPAFLGGSIAGVPFTTSVVLKVPPRSTASYNYTNINYILLNTSSANLKIIIISLKIPLINIIITIIMIIFFILMLAFLIVGFLFQTIYTSKSARRGDRGSKY